MGKDDDEKSSDKLLFDAIGSYGCWQKLVFAIFFYANCVGIFQNFAMTFLAPNTPYRCIQWSSNDTELWHTNSTNEWTTDQCFREIFHPSNDSAEGWTETVKCTKWEYNETGEAETLTSKFNLVCEREWLISFSKSVYMIGFMMSVLFFGQISDCAGRYITIVIAYSIGCTCVFASLFADSITTFLVFRFLQAFGRTGFTTTGYVLMLEVVGSEYRTRVGILIQFGWSFGLLGLALIGYLFRHWFWFELAIAIPLLPLIFCYRILPESPRWLMMRQKTEKLEKLIVVAAKRNGQRPPQAGISKDIINLFVKDKSQEKSGTVVDVFRSTIMRRRILNLMYCWAVNAFMYYGLSFNTNDLGGDPYINFLLASLLEFPAYGTLYITSGYFGRRFILVAFMLGGSIACGALLVLPGSVGVTIGLSLFGRYCITTSFGLLYLYTGELFPTVVRNASLGSCSTAARIGSIVAPFVREVARFSHDSVPNLIYFVLSLSSGILALWLPETAGKNLADTMEEGETFGLNPTSYSTEDQPVLRSRRCGCQC